MAKYLVRFLYSPIQGRSRPYRVAVWVGQRWRARPEWIDEAALADAIFLFAERQAANAN